MRTFGQAQPQSNVLIFRSNFTPEIAIDLNSLLTKDKTTPNNAVQGTNSLALNFIKPELIVTAFGLQKTIAPYGNPTENTFKYMAALLLIAGLLGAGISYSLCVGSYAYAFATAAIVAFLCSELGLIYQKQK